MRRPFIAGNWKMNLSREEAVTLAQGIVNQIGTSETEVAIAPSSVYLDAVSQVTKGSMIGLSAQNMYHEANGAFTGEISASMLLEMGCKYVILGHSERRHILGETDEDVNRKVMAALVAGLVPIVCIGETLDQREAGHTKSVVQQQFDGSLAGLTNEQMNGVVIAYEPVWAIGTGKVATPEQAEEVHADLRKLLETRYNSDVAAAVRIQYGGSVKPENAGELLGQPNIDGALVGGASLKVDSFLGIVAAAR
ncbi:MAG TPA: triose-phosphate isomerase [Pirellulaceae bacterium]|nr:triose-phosphate isomerase [Pirellulaceae bacterium]